MRHFLVLVLFAGLVSIVFGIVGREGKTERITYGIKIFFEFVVIALFLGWLLYVIPF